MSRELSTQRSRWGYDPSYVRCVTSDPEGNVLKVWFEPVVRGVWPVSRRMVMLVAVSASLAALMALQAVQQAFSAG